MIVFAGVDVVIMTIDDDVVAVNDDVVVFQQWLCHVCCFVNSDDGCLPKMMMLLFQQ